MPWRILINGVDKTTSIDQKSHMRIKLMANERGTASFVTSPGYLPTLRQEVLIYDSDGVTILFGGLVFSVATEGVGLLNFAKVECVDWVAYTSWRTASYTFSGNVTLLGMLQLLISNWLTDYGITLHGSQVVGPTVDATNYVWSYKPIENILRDATAYSGGYVFSISPAKVLRMVLSTSAPASPFSITTGASNVQRIEWEESSKSYATKVILRCGGTSSKELVQTWTVNAGHAAAGYLETDVPSTPTGGVSLTVNGVAKTIGSAGSQYVWNWATHRITPGTESASLADVFVLTYTAQYPFFSVADSGVTPPIEAVQDASDIIVKAIGDSTALGLLARFNQTTKEFDIQTTTAGLRPGQALTINLAAKVTGSVTALITDVEIDMVSDGFWRHNVKASTGIFKESSLQYFRELFGGSAPSAGFSGGVNTTIIASSASNIFLGGSGNTAVAESPAAYTGVANFVIYDAFASFTGVVRVDLWARNAGISVTARLYNTTSAADVGTSSTVTSTSRTSVSFNVTIVSGNRYRLEVLSSATDEGVYCVGTLSSL